MPANTGPIMKPRLEDIAIFPKFLLLSLSVDTSAKYAFATDMFPPVIPSIPLAKNRIINGRVMTKEPATWESILCIGQTGTSNAAKKIIHPMNVPVLLTNSTFFLPILSDHFPKSGAPIS